jgi:chemotaxis methyl-accepting protein methylase
MSTSSKRKIQNSHRINVILTEKQFQTLKEYAETREVTMSEAVRELIKAIPMKKTSTIE